jgi:hypothetical protein
MHVLNGNTEFPGEKKNSPKGDVRTEKKDESMFNFAKRMDFKGRIFNFSEIAMIITQEKETHYGEIAIWNSLNNRQPNLEARERKDNTSTQVYFEDKRTYEGIVWDKEDDQFWKYKYHTNMSENKWNFILKSKETAENKMLKKVLKNELKPRPFDSEFKEKEVIDIMTKFNFQICNEKKGEKAAEQE